LSSGVLQRQKGSVNYADSLLKEGICKFSALALTHNGKKEIPFGLATFSNYPIISSRKMDFSNTNMSFCLVTDIAFPTDTVRVINVHLESIRFRKEDYMFVNELANNRNSGNDLKQGSRVILSKMKRAYMKRAVQVNELKAIIADSPYRTMVCGDFNDTPTSYVYRQVTEPLQDAFKIAGSGLGQTYRELLPILRIDYILPDKSMKVFHYKTIHSDLSDHYPIVARIGL
jgi:endonuclease/exonuclease/phosphatase family metal-dependent hydrolase